MNRNFKAILAHLDLPMYDAVRDLIRVAFASRIKNAVEAWYKEVKAFDVAVAPRHEFPTLGYARTFVVEPKHVGEAGYYHQNAAAKAAVIAGEYRIHAAKVQEAADLEWQETKEFYAARVGKRIDELLQGEAQIACSLELNCFLVGRVTATLGEKELVLQTSLKTNYRYGVFAANRDLTVYRQVPTIVVLARGFDLPAREAELVRETLAAKDARRMEIGKWQKEILSLEKQKRAWDDIHHSLDYAAKYEKEKPIDQRHIDAINQRLAKLSLPAMVVGELTAKAAWAKIKELRVSIKTAKLTLREVRQVKEEA